MREKGDVFWDQLSMWDFAPANCIECYLTREYGTFHYVLKIVDEITSVNGYRTKYFQDTTKIPVECLLGSDVVSYSINQRVDGKRIQIIKGE